MSEQPHETPNFDRVDSFFAYGLIGAVVLAVVGSLALACLGAPAPSARPAPKIAGPVMVARLSIKRLPRCSVDNMTNRGRSYAKLLCKFCMTGATETIEAANFSHLISGQLGHSASLSSGASAFRFHVVHIVSLRAEKKIFDVYAWRVVATVQNVKPFRDWSVNQFISNAMSATFFPLRRTAPNLSIVAGVGASTPQNAAAGSSDAEPFFKTLFQGWPWRITETTIRAEFSSFGLGRRNPELPLAYFAHEKNWRKMTRHSLASTTGPRCSGDSVLKHAIANHPIKHSLVWLAPAPLPKLPPIKAPDFVARLEWKDLVGHWALSWGGSKWDTQLRKDGTYRCVLVSGHSEWVGHWWLDFEDRLAVSEAPLDKLGLPGAFSEWAVRWDRSAAGLTNRTAPAGTVVHPSGDEGCAFSLARKVVRR